MKKNILAAIAAITASASLLAGSSLIAGASSCAEHEYELAPPICVLPSEEIPQKAWDAIFEVMDLNGDNEVRVSDAIQAKKNGNAYLSDVICRFIINEGYTENITMSPVPLKEIADKIRHEQFQLVSVWEDGENAYFMFYNTKVAGFFVYETACVNAQEGFINLWDVDGDKVVTEKDAAKVYLESEDEQKATTISAYAQYGDGAFALSCQRYPNMDGIAPELERRLTEDGYELISISSESIAVFSYENGMFEFVF